MSRRNFFASLVALCFGTSAVANEPRRNDTETRVDWWNIPGVYGAVVHDTRLAHCVAVQVRRPDAELGVGGFDFLFVPDLESPARLQAGDLVEAVRESDHFLGVRAFRIAGCRVNVSK